MKLHSPVRIGGATIRNRLRQAEGAGDGGDVRATRRTSSRTRHGVGLIIQGSSCILPEGRTSPGMTCVDTQKMIRLAPMVEAVHGAMIFNSVTVAVRDGGVARAVRRTVGARCSPLRPCRPSCVRRFGASGHVLTTDEVRDAGAVRRSRRGRARRATTVCNSARPTPSCSTSSCRRSTTTARRLWRFARHRARVPGHPLPPSAPAPDYPCLVKIPVETAPPGFRRQPSRTRCAWRHSSRRASTP